MKKLLVILTLLLVGCNPNTPEKHSVAYGDNQTIDYRIVIIDDCEYLYGWEGVNGGPFLTHKGNCKNPVHQYQQQKTEIVSPVINERRNPIPSYCKPETYKIVIGDNGIRVQLIYGTFVDETFNTVEEAQKCINRLVKNAQDGIAKQR